MHWYSVSGYDQNDIVQNCIIGIRRIDEARKKAREYSRKYGGFAIIEKRVPLQSRDEGGAMNRVVAREYVKVETL